MNIFPSNYSRRTFLKASSAAAGGLALGGFTSPALAKVGGKSPKTATITLADLPKGTAPKPVSFPHFPSRLHAFVWRNWPLVTPERMASVVGAKPADISRMGRAMGLGDPPRITRDQQARSYITVIKRNWHLLPYEQLLELLGWSPEQLAFTLREDDFLWVKLGNLKPQCEPLRYQSPDEKALEREREIARIVRQEFPAVKTGDNEPLFGLVKNLYAKPSSPPAR